MKFTKHVIILSLFLFGFTAAFAQQGGLWERAFARPHGAILVDEIMFEPERFLVQHQGEKVTIGGKFTEIELTYEGNNTLAGIVWGGRYSGVACVSADRNEMAKVVDVVPGTEVLATGVVSEYFQGWLYLEQCTINEDVTLFHNRDPKFILGTWCAVYQGRVNRKYIFTRGNKGGYQFSTSELDGGGGWRQASGTQPARVKRISASRVETAIIGRTADYSRDRFTIVSHNQMSRSDGFQFHRCR